jgi:hypothetical protein
MIKMKDMGPAGERGESMMIGFFLTVKNNY